MRRATGDVRLQIKWFAFAVAILVASLILGSPLFGIAEELLAFTFLLVPVASAVAILKYRLYDIDVVISKTVVVGTLAAFITAVYLALVVGLGTIVGTQGEPNMVLSIAATAVVAVAFQPLRERAHGLANRVVYGPRATPYEVLSLLPDRMRETVPTEDVLPRLVRALADGTGRAERRRGCASATGCAARRSGPRVTKSPLVAKRRRGFRWRTGSLPGRPAWTGSPRCATRRSFSAC